MKRVIEQELIDKCIDGDANAFGLIYTRLKDPIFGFAYRMTRSQRIAEEITQEVFVFFIQNGRSFDPLRSSLFVYLCGIARNKTLNHLKKAQTKNEKAELDVEFSEATADEKTGSPLEELLEKELSTQFAKTLSVLTELQREVLLLRDGEGLSYSEIGQIVDADITTVKGRLFRARRTLIAELAPYVRNGEVKCI